MLKSDPVYPQISKDFLARMRKNPSGEVGGGEYCYQIIVNDPVLISSGLYKQEILECLRGQIYP